MAELDGLRIAPMFAADSDLEVGASLPAALNADADHLAHPLLIERLEMIFPEIKPPILVYSPVLACHIGPNGLGVIVYEGLEEGLRGGPIGI